VDITNYFFNHLDLADFFLSGSGHARHIYYPDYSLAENQHPNQYSGRRSCVFKEKYLLQKAIVSLIMILAVVMISY